MNVSERRRAPRVPVGVYLDQHIEGQSLRSFVTNLSQDGLYMERPLGSFVRHSTRVDLEIPIPDGQRDPLWASGEIVYDSFDALFHGTAVRFTHMSDRDRARLSRWLENDEADPSARAA